VHGPTALERAEQASQALFGGDITGLTGEDIQDIFAEVPSSELPKTQLEGEGLNVVDLLVNTGFLKVEGRSPPRHPEGGIYLNNQRVSEPTQVAGGLNDLLDGRFLVLRRGRKNYHLVKVID
jgi:tyrosyl-tRNA synthetase